MKIWEKKVTMKATDVLTEEHRLIEQVLNTLEAGSKRLESGQPVRPEFFLSATDFMRGFADGCHHQKEEGVLFTRMEARGIPTDGCPLGVMLAEHAVGRQYTRALHSAALAMQAGEDNADQRAIQSSRSYIAMLRQHIYKEDNILFPMANNVIPAEQHDQIWEDFEHVENVEIGQGLHEKYVALAEALKGEIEA
jgi:hemerythrin-like domain-containing protein